MISKIYSIDGKCIWMDAEFYSKDENAVPNPEATYTDVFGDEIQPPKDFSFERTFVAESVNGDNLSRILYNQKLASHIIAIFREDSMRFCVSGQGREILLALSEVFSCLLAGAFFEAALALAEIPENDFLTEERKNRYISMMQSSDAINYHSNEVEHEQKDL